MDTVIIQLTNQKAYKLLEDMEELDLIQILKDTPKISSLRGKLKTSMTNEEIDQHINEIRQEWQRDI